MMIEEDEPQTERNKVIEQQTSQNERGHQDKRPADTINLEGTDIYVKVPEGHEIHKDAVFLLEIQVGKKHQNNIPSI